MRITAGLLATAAWAGCGLNASRATRDAAQNAGQDAALDAVVFEDAAVHDAAGRMVHSLAVRLWSGVGALTWDGRSTAGDGVPAEVYFLRVQADRWGDARRLVRMR